MPYYVAVGNKGKQSTLLRLISYIDKDRGYSEKAFENMMQAIRITYQINDARGIISSPENMGTIYREAGDTQTAISYLGLAAQNAKPINPVRYNKIKGTIAMLNNELDSAIYYYQKSYYCVIIKTTDTIVSKKNLVYRSLDISSIYMMQHKFDLAIEQLKPSLQFFEKGHEKNGMMRVLIALANVYQNQQKFNTSFLYAKHLLKLAEETGARPFIRDAYQLYWQIYHQQGKSDSAYTYNLKYILIKDSILSDEYRRNLALSEMRSKDEQQKIKISSLQKDQQFIQERLLLQQQKIKSESLIKYVLIAVTIAFVLIGIFIF